jgi:hypothetical protein
MKSTYKGCVSFIEINKGSGQRVLIFKPEGVYVLFKKNLREVGVIFHIF